VQRRDFLFFIWNFIVWAPFSKRRLLRTCVRIQARKKRDKVSLIGEQKKSESIQTQYKVWKFMALDINQRTETHTIITAQPASRPPTGALFFVIKKKRYIIPSSHPLEAFKKREMYLELYRQTSSYLSFSLVRLSLSYTFISFLSGYKMISRLFSVVY
jgi:hypothetical protein